MLLQVPGLDLQSKQPLTKCLFSRKCNLFLLCLSFPSRNERRTSATSWSGWRATTTTPTAPGSTPTCTWRWSGLGSTRVGAKLDRVRRPSCSSQCPRCAERGARRWARNTKMWRQWRRSGLQVIAPRKITVMLFTTDSPWCFILLQPLLSFGTLQQYTNAGPPVHPPDAITALLIVSKGHRWHHKSRRGGSFCGSVTEITQKTNRWRRKWRDVKKKMESYSCLY